MADHPQTLSGFVENISMKMILIRFLLTYGHSVDVIGSADDAQHWVAMWNGNRTADRVGGTDKVGRVWSLNLKEVLAIVTSELPQQPQQGPVQQQVSPCWGNSGLGF